MGTIRDLNELTAPAANDWVFASDTSDPVDPDKKMAMAKLALLSTAQSWSAQQTFNAGIKFGQAGALDYFDSQPWTPVVADAVTGGNVQSGSEFTASGRWVRLGPLCILWASILNITKAGMTAGNNIFIRNVPFASAYLGYGTASVSRMTFTMYTVARILATQTSIQLIEHTSGTSLENPMTWSDVASDTFTDFYFTLPYLVA